MKSSGWTGLFCPCVLFGRNYENLRDDYASTTTPCVLHAIFIEGGLALAATTAALHGVIDPRTSFLICEGVLFGWWMCGIYTGIVRQMLQKKYHLKVISASLQTLFLINNKCDNYDYKKKNISIILTQIF